MILIIDMEGRIKALMNLVGFVSSHDMLGRSWCGISEIEVSSFEEILCQFYDDLGLDEVIESPQLCDYLTDVQIKLLKKLHSSLVEVSKKFPDYTDPKLILDSFEWKMVEDISTQLAVLVGIKSDN